jgi:fucose permease
MMVGRFLGSALMQRIRAETVLAPSPSALSSSC